MENITRFASGRRLDVVCLGRFGVDFYAQQIGARLEDVTSFAKYLGGSSANTAFGCARLGLKAGLISRIGNDANGRFLVETIAREGCDTSHVSVDPQRLTAAVVLGIKDKDTFPLIFLRENCADMAIGEDEIEESLHRLCARAAHHRHALLDRVHQPHQQPGARPRAPQRRAHRARHRLPAGAVGPHQPRRRRDALHRLRRRHRAPARGSCPKFDLVIGTIEEFNIAGGSLDIMASLRAVRAVTKATLVVKRGPMGCAVIDGAIPASLDDAFNGEGVEVEVLNVLGAGDAFSVGIPVGLGARRGLRPLRALRERLRCARRVAPRLRARDAHARRARLFHRQRGVDSAAGPGRDADAPASRHRAAHAARDEVFAFAFDHRNPFFDLAQRAGAAEARLPALKQLAGRSGGRNGSALRARRQGRPSVRRPLRPGRAQRGDRARLVDRPAGRAAGLESRCSSIAAARSAPRLSSWPAEHVVKCLVQYHPDDPVEHRLEQEAQIRALYDAVQASGHELLLEIIPPKHLPRDEDTVLRALKRLYNLGIYPEWWKLEPMSPAQWTGSTR